MLAVAFSGNCSEKDLPSIGLLSGGGVGNQCLCRPTCLRGGGPAPANFFSCRSLSLQSYYQNLLADHQAGVGTSALFVALSKAFLETR